MSYFRFLAGLLAFMLLVVTIVFFRDNNMNWWLFMFAFIIVAGFMAQPYDDEHDDDKFYRDSYTNWYSAHCIECGYINRACMCKPVVNDPVVNMAKSLSEYPDDWEEYKASYVEPECDDTDWVVIAMNNRDFEIANKTPDDEENEEIPF
tara:strand:+ start:356 stop:802 length:447 start_codon:yes stop_codon:yes gene_type:complete